MYHVYFLKSLKNNKVYIGRTAKSPNKRLAEHNVGANTWTRVNKPFKLIYFESYFCLSDATARERFYKMGFGKKIKSIIVRELA